jgi:Helix-turn-helix domain
MGSGEEWLSPKKLAEQFGLSVTLVYTLCQSGALPHVRIGAPGRRGKILISMADWTAFLAARRVEVVGARVMPGVRPAPEFKHLKIRRPGGEPHSASGCDPGSDAHSA